MVYECKCCQNCDSEQTFKNGTNGVGNPKYTFKACGFGGVFQTLRKSAEFQKL